MEIIVSWLLLSLAVWLTGIILPGFKVKGVIGALVAGAVFGALHWAIGWVLFVLIGIGTLGIGFILAFITRWVVDAILLKITDALTDRLEIKSFGWAFIGALVISGIGSLTEYVLQTNMAGPATEIHL